MEGGLNILVPLIRLVSYSALVIVFFVFIVRPLLNYIIVEREIERRKRLNQEMAAQVAVVTSSRPSLSHQEESEPLLEEEEAEVGSAKMTDKQTLSRLALSDSDKAADLVRQWVHTDSSPRR